MNGFLNASWLQSEIGNQLEMDVAVALAKSPLPPSELSRNENLIFQSLRSGSRRQAWLRGRGALKELLTRFHENPETSAIHFPNSRFSLSHSGAYAIAVGVSADQVLGIGVDFQVRRTLSASLSRRFLSEDECRKFLSPNKPNSLLRLWSIKEALYKANPENRRTVLSAYSLVRPDALKRGLASSRSLPMKRFIYCSMEFADGFLAVAICPRNEGTRLQNEKTHPL